ncbi:hypothetical protein HWI79_277 [Cryptosporidium felis]|nr:hypothetical protein HWI79_277 [Cryptosporidium felis]
MAFRVCLSWILSASGKGTEPNRRTVSRNCSTITCDRIKSGSDSASACGTGGLPSRSSFDRPSKESFLEESSFKSSPNLNRSKNSFFSWAVKPETSSKTI